MQFLTTTESYISLFFTLALMLVMLYFMIYRPQKKQEKKDAAMRSSLEIGDQVTTIGGVIGRVVDPLHQERHQLCREAEHGQRPQEVIFFRIRALNASPCIQ